MIRMAPMARSSFTKRSAQLRQQFAQKQATAGLDAGHGRNQYRAARSLIVSDGVGLRVVPENAG